MLLEKLFGFCKWFKEITKCLGFELDLRTSNRNWYILYTTLGDAAVNITIVSLNLCIPTINPSPETQTTFNEIITKSFTLSNEWWATDRKPVNTSREFQLDVGSSSKVQINLIATPQKTQRIDPDSTIKSTSAMII